MKAYIDIAPPITAGPDGMVHLPEHLGMPPVAMTREAALAMARGLLAAVAELEKREAATRAPTPMKRTRRR